MSRKAFFYPYFVARGFERWPKLCRPATWGQIQPWGSTRPQLFWERVGEQGLHTGLRELSSLPM